ncbi:glutathione S-transferase family protein [Azorhizobium doebereinerae]|uniref:glutathione S-transferase family protein n=1 Tax=Azorhizobium doebereinerae TaxID=281091 RepID=UPI00040892D1|nr:glutathione S-transferase family protein [Azorhizobium doebereinerae]
MANIQFYMTPGSCSTGIHVLLEEVEDVFEVTVVNLPAGDQFKPDYVAINPKSTIPTLVRRDGTALTEVPAIAFWLARTHPRAGLWPQDAEREARLIEAMAYMAATVHGQGFARIFATATFARNPADHPAVQALGRDIVRQGFAVLAAALGDKPYLDDGFCAADPILFYLEFWADKLGMALPEAIAGHYRRMLARPAVQRVLREEGYNLATLGNVAILGAEAAAAMA